MNLIVAKIAWEEERTKQLIKAYEMQVLLWNPDHRDHHNRFARSAAWRALAEQMELSVRDVKLKLYSLIGVFRRQTRRGVKKPRWWSCHMSFLLNVDEFRSKLSKGEKEDLDGSDPEFIATDSTKRTHLTAFEEFQAEYVPSKRPVVITECTDKNLDLAPESSNNNVIELDDYSNDEWSETNSPSHSKSSTVNNDDDTVISTYCKFLESKLKGYSMRTRNAIQYNIHRILYEADMGILEKTDANNVPLTI